MPLGWPTFSMLHMIVLQTILHRRSSTSVKTHPQFAQEEPRVNAQIDTSVLEQRIVKLERQNQNLKKGGGIVALIVIAIVGMGQASPQKIPKTIEANQFIIRDNSGQ